MDKISGAEVNEMTKLAASALRALSAENRDLKAKVAHYEKKEHAEKVASLMDDKGIQPELSHEEKVTNLLAREDLHVVEEAVSMSSPQMKVASVIDDRTVTVEGVDGMADAAFAAALSGI